MISRILSLCLLLAAIGLAQPPTLPQAAPPAPPAIATPAPPAALAAREAAPMAPQFATPAVPTAPPAPPAPRASRPPMERSMPPGRWWDNPAMVQRLALNSDQQKKIDDTFQQNRLRLVDLNATLQKEEIIMEPLMQADTPDESRILAQIDKVAQARAELEKANARFLLGIRRILTQDQWKKLQTDTFRPAQAPMPTMAPAGVPPPPPAKKR